MNDFPPMTQTDLRVKSDRWLCVCGSAIALVALGDYLLWNFTPGFSLGLFTAAIALAIALNRSRAALTGRIILIGALLLGASVQSGIEVSFSNILVALVLLLLLMTETFYLTLPAGWARWSEGVWAFVKAPGRWFWLGQKVAENRSESSHWSERMVRAARAIVPGLLIAGVFAAILSSGNAIFGKWSGDAFRELFEALKRIDLSFGRLFFWFFLATAALVALAPSPASAAPRFWTWQIRTLPPAADLQFAKWRSLILLALVNGVFFIANTIDAIYLWFDGKVPKGVSHSEFVHQGVWALTFAVLLAAAVLTAIFQQADEIARSRPLRVLAHIWIVQNLALVASVLLRLKLYVDAHQASLLRVYVAFFLILVGTGFALLAWHIERRKTLNWLLLANAGATVAMFYFVQFLDVAGGVARYNVNAWQRDPRRGLDIGYLRTLGAPAWPALTEAGRDPRGLENELKIALEAARNQASGNLALNWRSWQSRRDVISKWLLSQETNHNP